MIQLVFTTKYGKIELDLNEDEYEKVKNYYQKFLPHILLNSEKMIA